MRKIDLAKVRVVVWCLVAIGMVCGLIGAQADIEPLGIFGLIVLIGGLVFHMLFYRCPHCGKFLGRNMGEFCPYCGKELR